MLKEKKLQHLYIQLLRERCKKRVMNLRVSITLVGKIRIIVMKDKALNFNRNCHVLYSRQCKKEILNKIALHYPKEDREKVFTDVQKQYVAYLKNYRTDLGGKANFHNGVAGTYDCIALFSYYVVCKEKTSLQELEEMNCNLFLPAFKKIWFVDCNKPLFRWIMYQAFLSSKKKCDKWNDFKMSVYPYKKDEPVRYEFTTCPIAEFAKDNNLLEALSAMCNADFAAMECIHAKLVRKTTCGNGCVCDYAIYGDKDTRLAELKEYIDSEGYRRNR